MGFMPDLHFGFAAALLSAAGLTVLSGGFPACTGFAVLSAGFALCTGFAGSSACTGSALHKPTNDTPTPIPTKSRHVRMSGQYSLALTSINRLYHRHDPESLLSLCTSVHRDKRPSSEAPRRPRPAADALARPRAHSGVTHARSQCSSTHRDGDDGASEPGGDDAVLRTHESAPPARGGERGRSRRKGRRTDGPVPFGDSVVDKRPVVDELESLVVREAVTLQKSPLKAASAVREPRPKSLTRPRS